MNQLNIKHFSVVSVLITTALLLSACGSDSREDSSNDETDSSVSNTPIDTAGTSTLNILCDYSNDTFNDSESVQDYSTAYWSCSDTSRDLTANGIPDHDVGVFPNAANPNTIAAQGVSASFSISPTQANSPTQLGGPRGNVAFILNGIKVDAGTGGSCDDSGTNCSLGDPSGGWSIEALGQPYFDFGTDDNNAHVQPGGSYHYHGIPEGFVALRGGSASTMTLIGWAADGFPIYARYGYADPNDASSQLVEMRGSYQLVTTVSADRPSTEVYQLGTFAQDWKFAEGVGDLDECNGRFGVTPEFPDGIFHYYATDTYPYFQRCVSGEM